VDANSTGTSGQSYTFYLNYPGYIRNPAGTIAQITNVASLFANEQKVFDQYKVKSLTIKYLPFVTSKARVDSAVAFTAPTDSTLIMTDDYDDSALFVNISKALNCQNPSIYNCYNGSMPTLTMRQQDPVDAAKWLNCQVSIPSGSASADPNNTAKLSSVKIWKQGYQLMSTGEANIFAEWLMVYKGMYTIS